MAPIRPGMTPLERWQLIASILGFFAGIALLIFDGIIQPPSDPVTSGFGILLTGLGPAAVKDYLDRRSS